MNKSSLSKTSGSRSSGKSAPEERDYLAAHTYLSLLMQVRQAERVVKALRAEEQYAYKATDLLRALPLPLLAYDDALVAHNIEKVREGKSLVPILLVRCVLLEHAPLVIADGYHRICAAYHLNEDLDIPCLIVNWPPQTEQANE
jgi:hypothetical protein